MQIIMTKQYISYTYTSYTVCVKFVFYLHKYILNFD